MICVRSDLIEKELNRDKENGFCFKYKKLSKKFLDWLFRHYYIEELCENFYDSEPEFDDEEFQMYLDYKQSIEITGRSFWEIITNIDEIEKEKSNFRFSKQNHTREELKNAYEKIKQQYEDYESHRICFCNWQEPYFKGNWEMSQSYVDSFGRDVLNKIRKGFPVSIKNRLYTAQKEDLYLIYFYGRDLWKVDYWFIFKKRGK